MKLPGRHLRQGVIAAVFLTTVTFSLWYILSSVPIGEVIHRPSQKRDIQPKPMSIHSTILFTGNSFWGRYTNDAAKKTSTPYSFPFARLHEFEREKYDAWITGLECPTTKKGAKMTSAQMEATLTFNCDPAYLPEFAKWFTAVSLANNHTDNMGKDGFKETQSALEQQGVQYAGHYDPEELDDVCEVVSLPVRVKTSDNAEEKGDLPVAICGYHFVFKLPSAASIAKISEYASVMPTIVMPHGGAEYKPAPDQIKTQLLRSMVDAGADMVIGDHPHWIQSTEVYKGRLIVYSMGNFMFDQQSNAEVTRSAAIRLKLNSESVDSDQLEQWLKLGASCKIYHDDCLTRAKTANLKKISLKYHFSPIATSDKGYQTRLAPELQAEIERRLRWAETSRKLGQ